MKKKKGTVQTPTEVIDDEGNVSQSWTDADTLTGTFLPMSGELAQRVYGFTDDVEYRFFYRGHNDNLITGNRIVIDDLTLYIVYVADFGKVMDVLLCSHIKDG